MDVETRVTEVAAGVHRLDLADDFDRRIAALV